MNWSQKAFNFCNFYEIYLPSLLCAERKVASLKQNLGSRKTRGQQHTHQWEKSPFLKHTIKTEGHSEEPCSNKHCVCLLDDGTHTIIHCASEPKESPKLAKRQDNFQKQFANTVGWGPQQWCHLHPPPPRLNTECVWWSRPEKVCQEEESVKCSQECSDNNVSWCLPPPPLTVEERIEWATSWAIHCVKGEYLYDWSLIYFFFYLPKKTAAAFPKKKNVITPRGPQHGGQKAWLEPKKKLTESWNWSQKSLLYSTQCKNGPFQSNSRL